MLALICGLPVNKAQCLSEDGYLRGASSSFLISLKNALIDCVTIVSESIKLWVNDYRGNNLKNDSLYQIYHMIVSVFRNKYDLDLKIKTVTQKEANVSKKWIDNFKKYAFIHYLNDVVTNYWSINRQVTDLTRELNETAGSMSKYTFDISKNTLIDGFSSFSEESILKATGKTADNTTKLLLNYFYRLKEKKTGKNYFKKELEISDADFKYSFDIEHIVPKEKFEKFGKEVFSISYIGNLCYLSIKDNRSKRNLTLYEYADSRPALKIDEEFVKFIEYPSRDELGFIDCNLDEFKNPYQLLIKNRGEKVLKELAEMLANE